MVHVLNSLSDLSRIGSVRMVKTYFEQLLFGHVGINRMNKKLLREIRYGHRKVLFVVISTDASSLLCIHIRVMDILRNVTQSCYCNQ